MMYLQILYESAWAASILPLSSNATYAAMLGFGGYNMALASVCVLIGAMGGYAFNWWLGTRLIALQAKGKLRMSPALYDSCTLALNRYLFWLLGLSWLPMMNFLVLAAGFFKMPARKALLLAITGHAVYLVWLLYSHSA